MPRDELLERAAELDVLRAAVSDALVGRGSLVFVEGVAGLGKTSLLRAAVDAATEIGVKALTARGAPLEREFAVGVARRLFEREVLSREAGERDALITGPARVGAAALGIEFRGVGAVPAGSGEAALHGLYWLVANLAAEQPLLLVVDDVHWADSTSLRFIAYLAERVSELPVAVVVAARPRQHGADQELLDQIRGIPGVRLVRPLPLSESAVEEVLKGRFHGPLPEGLARSCHVDSGGNPFLVRALTSELGDRGIAAGVGGAGMEGVARWLLLRVAGLPEEARELGRAVAVLGTEVDFRVAAELAGLTSGEASVASDLLADADLLRPSRPLDFVHPLVRSAVYGELGPGERDRAHARAAELLLKIGSPPEHVASHLLACPSADRPDFADVLRLAAQGALERGVPEIAASYLARAVEEVAGGSTAGELLCDLGLTEFLAGADPERARQHLEAGIPLVDDESRRCAAWVDLARTTMAYVGAPEAVAVLDRALTDLPDLEEDARLRLMVERNGIGVSHAESFALTADLIDATGDVPGTTVAERLQLCHLAYRVGQLGTDRRRTVELCRRAFADGILAVDEGTENNAVSQGLYTWWFTDLLGESLVHCDAILERARARGSTWGMVSAGILRAGNRFFAGDLAGCEADARQAIGVPGFPPFAVSGYVPLVWALVERGELDEADALLARAGCGPDLPPIHHMELLLYSRGLVRAAQGRHLEALADLMEYGERSERVGAHNPAIPWRAHAALAQARLGDADAARDLATEHQRRADDWGAPSTVGVALRTQGLVTGGSAGLELLQAAVTVLAPSPARHEHARALVELGAALRRMGHTRDARRLLQEGLEQARRALATALVRRAHDELMASGARPRRLVFTGVESLTASERRVAELAATGLSNRAIAEQLYVTAKTVEKHLGRAYAKLGIAGREQLQDALGQFAAK